MNAIESESPSSKGPLMVLFFILALAMIATSVMSAMIYTENIAKAKFENRQLRERVTQLEAQVSTYTQTAQVTPKTGLALNP